MIRPLVAALAPVFCSIVLTAAQGDAAESVFRVFLLDGRALSSHGEPAWVGDRVVFTMVIGEPDAGRQQTLVDLPAASIDRERTRAYADSLRAAFYARTRAEADFAAMTEDLARAVDRLPAIADPFDRLAAGEQARERILDFQRRSRGYRAADIGVLLVRFDQVLADLRAAAGDSALAFELSSGPGAAAPEPLLPPVGLRESIALALAAVSAADTGADRLSILRAAAAAVPDDPAFDDLRAAVATRVDMERTLDREYFRLDRDLRGRAATARERGDPEAIARALADLDGRDAALGRHRIRLVGRLRGDLEAWHASARAFRSALDRYAAVRADLLAYERRVRPALVAFDGLAPIIEALRDLRFTGYANLLRADTRLAAASERLAAVVPPPDLAAVHATFASALHLAREAVVRRKQAAATAAASTNQEAASAAAGALLLVAQARQDLVTGLFPPKPR